MYKNIIDLLESNFQLTLLHLIYDILSNEIDNAIWLESEDFDKPMPSPCQLKFY